MFLAKDKNLLEAFKRGDRDAMETVYRHYRPGLTSFLRKGFSFNSGTGTFYFKGIPDEGDINAAVQEVFRRAFEDRARQSYNGINSFTNWILAIARNLVINQFRNKEIAFSNYISIHDGRSHLTVMDDEITEDFSGVLYGLPVKAQDTQFENAEIKQLVRNFLSELSDHDRKLITLRFAEGLGQEDAAKAIGSTRMKVRTIEAKLRSRLRAYLRNTGYIDHLSESKDPDEG